VSSASSARGSGAFAIIATLDLSTRDAKLKLMIVSNQTIADRTLFEYSLRANKQANLRNAKYYSIVEYDTAIIHGEHFLSIVALICICEDYIFKCQEHR